jgi:hypothetical protein
MLRLGVDIWVGIAWLLWLAEMTLSYRKRR